MNAIIDVLGKAMGYIMFYCYRLFDNYILAIILFTFISKILLMPVSVWVQKNSIKMVKMMPALNEMRARYYGNQNKISEEQMKLYKKEHYHILGDLIPLLLQVVILLGVVNVIYNPMTHILHMDQPSTNQLVTEFAAEENLSIDQSGLQVMTAEDIIEGKHGDLYKNASEEDIKAIKELKFFALGFNLAKVPSRELGKYVLVPILAAFSAFLLCMAQNKSNVLQVEQSMGNKIFTTSFSVILSLYLGFFVPVGVGVYWVFSNLFAILQLYVLNYFINPKNYIDYEGLEASRQLLKSMEGNVEKKKKRRDPYQKKCNEDYKRFLQTENKKLVFYSENKGFYKYYKDVIAYLIEKSDIVIHYITSDGEDPVLTMTEPQIKSYYINERKLIYLMMKMDADIVVMTTPDLEKYHIKRSIVRKDIEYIYLDHGINSNNLTLRKNALDYFDTLFSANQIAIDETRAVEKYNQSKEKRLVKFGSCVVDDMIEAYDAYRANYTADTKKKILIAPSWQKDNILDLCVTDILDELKDMDYAIVVRPHPQYIRHCKEQFENLAAQYKENKNIEFQSDFSSNSVVYEADLLITDWSSIAFEYAFGTLHPVLFVNTPMKIMNLDYDKIDVTPMDILLREIVGRSIDVEDLKSVKERIHTLLETNEFSKEHMEEIREKYLFNIGISGKIGATYLMKRLQ